MSGIRLSLRQAVPGALFVLGAALTGLAYVQETTTARRDIVRQVNGRAVAMGQRIAGKLTFFAARHDSAAAILEVAGLGGTPDIRRAFAVDGADTIRISTDSLLQGRPLAAADSVGAEAAVRVRNADAGEILIAGGSLLAVYPFRESPPGAASSNPSFGLVVLAFDLVRPTRQAELAAAQRSLTHGIVVLVLCLLAWFATNRLLNRPVAALVEASHRLAAGQPAAELRPSGLAEIAQLTGSFNQMAAGIAARQTALATANRALRTTSHCNQVVVRATAEPDLLQAVCDVIVKEGDYALAWVGYVDPEQTSSFRAVACTGVERPDLQRLDAAWADSENGPGPVAIALRTGQPAVCHDFIRHPPGEPWRHDARRLGYRSALVLPLTAAGSVLGALSVYSVAHDAFDEAEVALLTELAQDLAYGVQTLRARGERERLVHDLGERVKEVTALHRVTRLLQEDRPFDRRLLEELVSLLPPAWQYPDITEARIEFDGLVVQTRGWRETQWTQRAKFVTGEKQEGTVAVAYREERPKQAEGPFLREERNLLDSVADLLTTHLARREAERALVETNAKLNLAMDVARLGYWEYDVASDRFVFDEHFLRLYGTSPEREGGTGLSSAEYSRRFIPGEESGVVAEEIAIALAATDPHFTRQVEHRIVRADGSPGHVMVRYAIVKDADGRTIRTYGASQDITERHQAARALRDMELQLRQSQKMEAIGQLAGGVAHDFNNILAVMMMQVGLARTDETASAELRESLQDISLAAERGANLTRQLLLFGRKQVMQPRNLDLNEIVTGLMKMLQRVLRADIHTTLRLHPAPLQVMADPGMIDQVLLNLAVNARDAMPSGGDLVFETGERIVEATPAGLGLEVPPGRYASLRVRDTGTGIAPEHREHIFEPFFTTKEPGKGTGLGLATVFGIIKQHRGTIQLQSETGLGSTFEILLPRLDGSGQLDQARKTMPRLSRGSETVLVVEDDEDVRTLTRMVLEQNGYVVVTAANGVEALRLWDEHGSRVQLLLTDLVMPGGVSGHELAARLQARAGSLRVVFTSGYSAEIAGRELQLREGQNFLQKPYPPGRLLETIRKCLDG